MLHQKNALFADLNPEQCRACKNYQGPSLILAGAGSGKTRVITFRIANMLMEEIPPQNILALTFTKKAAQEMQERIASKVGVNLSSQIWMGTFHSIFSRILHTEAEKLGFTSNFTITDDSKTLIKNIVEYLHLGEEYQPKRILERISIAKNNLYTAEAYSANQQLRNNDREDGIPELHAIYKMYVQRCRINNMMDFDDLLLYPNILFKQYPEILNKYQEKFQYILVDEYQDTNSAQYLIIKKLSENHRNICVVGDDAQSIYAFRGAKVENILRFSQDYNDCKTFKLEQNYRSTQTIVKAANSVISKNSSQLQKVCFSSNNVGDKIQYFQAFSDQDEVNFLVDDLKRRLREQHLRYNNIAVLYRTHSLTRTLEHGLQRNGIPYKIYAGKAFYQRKEVKDLLAYITLAINPSNDDAFLRVVNYPLRGIGTSTCDKLAALSHDNNCSIWELLLEKKNVVEQHLKSPAISKLMNFIELIKDFCNEKNSLLPQELVLMIANKSGIIFTLKSVKDRNERERLESVEQVINSVTEFCEIYIEEKGEQPTIENYLEYVSLMSDSDTQDDNDNKVALMTIHAAKGLEFDWVYIIGMEQGLFPSSQSMQSTQDMEEERRLFYVAITRAKQGVSISSSKKRFKWGEITDCKESIFLSDISPEYIEGFQNTPMFISHNPPQKLQNSSTKIISPKVPKTPLPENFNPTLPHLINEKDRVLHPIFGLGKIVKLEVEKENRKATVRFDNTTENKVLLLKFAKLMVIP